MATRRRLYRQGNSIVAAMPIHILDHMKLREGDQVDFKPGPNQTVTLFPIRLTGPNRFPQKPSIR